MKDFLSKNQIVMDFTLIINSYQLYVYYNLNLFAIMNNYYFLGFYFTKSFILMEPLLPLSFLMTSFQLQEGSCFCLFQKKNVFIEIMNFLVEIDNYLKI